MTTPAAHHDHQDVPGTAQDVPDVLDELDGPALHAQLRADTDLLTAAAAALRHAATQDAYRGRPDPEHAYALASALEMARLRWLDQDPALRARLRTCSHILLDTRPEPDGPPGPDQRR